MRVTCLSLCFAFLMAPFLFGAATYRATGTATSIDTVIPLSLLPDGVGVGATFSLEFAVDTTVPLNVGFTKTQGFSGFVGPDVAFSGSGATLNVFPAGANPRGIFLFDLFDVESAPQVTGPAADLIDIQVLEFEILDDFFAANPGIGSDDFPVNVPSDLDTSDSIWEFGATVVAPSGLTADLTIIGVVDGLQLLDAGDTPDDGGGTPGDGGGTPGDGGGMPGDGGGTPGDGGGMPGDGGGMPDDGGNGTVPEPNSLAIWLLLGAVIASYRRWHARV